MVTRRIERFRYPSLSYEHRLVKFHAASEQSERDRCLTRLLFLHACFYERDLDGYLELRTDGIDDMVGMDL